MNYRRWFIVGFVAALAIFSFYHLSTAGSDYKSLTTSDSGFFYGIAREMNYQDGMIDTYELSHPPQGKPVPKGAQFQPLMLVSLYRGLHAVDPSISLMGVCQYFSPFLFAIAMIGAFLAARELGGDLAGCASALFFSTLVGSIYWTKVGAFDREITLIFFGTWLFYLLAKVFKARGMEILKYSAIGGLIYGMFITTWLGAPFLGVILGLALVLIILERAVAGSGLILTSIVLFVLGHAFSGFDVPELIGIFLFLAGLVRLAMDWESLENIENEVFSNIRSNFDLIGGSVLLIVVASIVAIGLGGYPLDFWAKMITDRIPGFLGMGGGGASFPQVATEMTPVPSDPGGYLNNLTPKLYGSSLLTGVTIALVMVGILKSFWTSKKRELLALSWLIIIAPMPLSQARFFRLFWPMWPVLAGFGFGALVWMADRATSSPLFSTSDWLEQAQRPVALALIGIICIVPFVHNVRSDARASDTTPWPHGGSLPTNYYHSLLDSFNWIEENTPENSNVVIPWSYGHFATGATERASVTDGANVNGWRDNWEDSTGIKPPDYIRYASGGQGYIIGVNVQARENQINGRRIDVQDMITTGDEDKFRFLVNSYRENYGVNMDYVVFNDSVSGGGTMRQSVLFSMATGLQQTQGVTTQGMNYIFNFKQENIVFNFRGAPTTQAGGKELAGYVLYNAEAGRLLNYSFTQSPEESKMLWVFFTNKGAIQGGGLSDFNGIPMLLRALEGYEMPGFLREAYRSPEGPTAVYRIAYVPRPTSPENELAVNDNTPVLSWDESVNGVKYEVSVDDSSSFESPVVLENVSGTSHELSDPLSDGTYYWRVRSYDRDGETEGWSSTSIFEIDTVPTSPVALKSPEDGSELIDRNVSFTWSEVEGAESYELWIDNDENFASPILNKEKDITKTSFEVPYSGLNKDNYYWKVRTVDAPGNKSDWSETWSFELIAPSLQTPENGAELTDNLVAFEWSEVPRAENYDLWVDNNDDFSSPELKELGINAETYQVSAPGLENGSYFWMVRARDVDGGKSPWSGVWTFEVNP